MATVEITELRKSYGVYDVIHGIDLSIEDGEFISLIGASGCGKSTLLRMVAGLEEITDGTIQLNGRIINNVAPKNRDIAMVFQNYALYPHLTVAENMGFSLKLRRGSKEDIRKAVESAADLLGLRPYLDRLPKALSGGQRQRVAMGRAIVRQPQVFLFDEPLSNLDAKLRVQMRFEIKSLQRRLGTTSIYVTHDQMEAMTMSDRIVILNGGRVEQIGAPLELYDRPANVFVAGFIGSPTMNLFEGNIIGGVPASFRTKDGLTLPIIDSLSAGSDGRPALYGVRPENFEIDNEHGVPATVNLIEPTGSETLIFATLRRSNIVAAFRHRIDLEPGEIIKLRPTTTHLFDPTTGERMLA